MRNVVFTKEHIQNQIANMADSINYYYQITRQIDYPKSEKPLMIIPILKGGMFFYVDLVRHLKFQNELGLIATSKYANGYPTEQEFSFKYFDAFCEDQCVLLVDEICFTGETLEKTSKHLLENCGAKEVRTAVLINQVIEPERKKHMPTWQAVNYHGKEWVYGYGMDINGLYRNLEDIVYDEKTVDNSLQE